MDPCGSLFVELSSGQIAIMALISVIFFACSVRLANGLDGCLMSEPRMPMILSIVHWTESEGGPILAVSGLR